MSNHELLAKYERIHAYFMADSRFWYERGRQVADMIICVLASDLRLALRVSPTIAESLKENKADMTLISKGTIGITA